MTEMINYTRIAIVLIAFSTLCLELVVANRLMAEISTHDLVMYLVLAVVFVLCAGMYTKLSDRR